MFAVALKLNYNHIFYIKKTCSKTHKELFASKAPDIYAVPLISDLLYTSIYTDHVHIHKSVHTFTAMSCTRNI